MSVSTATDSRLQLQRYRPHQLTPAQFTLSVTDSIQPLPTRLLIVLRYSQIQPNRKIARHQDLHHSHYRPRFHWLCHGRYPRYRGPPAHQTEWSERVSCHSTSTHPSSQTRNPGQDAAWHLDQSANSVSTGVFVSQLSLAVSRAPHIASSPLHPPRYTSHRKHFIETKS